MRRTSGITHITVFTHPDECGGNCLYCPNAPTVPKSYLPHSFIGNMNLTYSSHVQLSHWLDQNTRRRGAGSKLEVIILGGSFTKHPKEYRRQFLEGLYKAVDQIDENEDISLEELVAKHHERSTARHIIGITIESRPNLITEEMVDELFRAGVTKIEMGVQSLDDEVLDFVERGHAASAVSNATEIIRRYGLKVGYHMLFGMAGSSMQSDLDSVNKVFDSPDFQPDHIKFYFCEMFKREFMRPRLVELFDSGEWRPWSVEKREEMLEKVLPNVPDFMRISRIGRKSAENEHEEEKLRINRSDSELKFGCRCVRCREPKPNRETNVEDLYVHTDRLGDKEVYFEVKPRGYDVCLGLLRFRLNDDHAIVRELHVYGLETKPGEDGIHQHKGVGKMLMQAAEEFVESNTSFSRIGVASGVGVRKYYESLGYEMGEKDFVWKSVLS